VRCSSARQRCASRRRRPTCHRRTLPNRHPHPGDLVLGLSHTWI
jgi:hypothetical protein